MAFVATEKRGVTGALPGDSTRALYPHTTGYVERDGVRSFYEVYGDGGPTIMLLPTWSLVHSRIWKAQVAYLARHHRVITFDGRGNGRSDRPQNARAYNLNQFGEDAIAVLDATDTESAAMASISAGTLWNLYLASQHPGRVDGAVFVGPFFPVSGEWPDWMTSDLLAPAPENPQGAERYNLAYIRENFEDFAGWWIARAGNEPHNATGHEYGLKWALTTDGETIAHTLGPLEEYGFRTMKDFVTATRDALVAMANQMRCPVLVLQGELEEVTPASWAKALAGETGGRFVVLPDTGHTLGRKPVPINLAIHEFLGEL
jgi:pimeloyl-ACP methyl ester carboxylesterase